ncbi:MAG: hypothetical protein QF552_11550 [Litorilituus sp.]|jgi:drug/metabolite transporter (DMT)-like permease|nr:hypothetical protein [Litorilituus sp.]
MSLKDSLIGVPVIGILCSSIFLDEVITKQQYIGISFVMIGLIFNAAGGKCFTRKP